MSDAFRALADPSRREILRLLRDGPRTSGEIADHFPTSWATISRHLAMLRDAGLILSVRSGQQVIYELNTTVFEDLVNHLLEWTRPSNGQPSNRDEEEK
jgi:DNA-binding transcriptional ArsR family regulator